MDPSVEPRIERRTNGGRAAAGRTLDAINDGIGRIWDLGRNNVVAWRPAESGIDVLVAPGYAVLDRADSHERITYGTRYMGRGSFAAVSRILGIKHQQLKLDGSVGRDRARFPGSGSRRSFGATRSPGR